jgi:ADP-heptose:LPS heptosyltransferase
MKRILVIKLGALGDFVQAMGPAAAIRAHHPEAEITLLTTAPFAELARAAPYFDRVWIDQRLPRWHLPALWRLRKRLRTGSFDRIYDLQTSGRSSFYFELMRPGRRPEWSGIARGASHYHANPTRDFMHNFDRQADQLRIAGIEHVPRLDLSWAAQDVSQFRLPDRFLLLVPGCSPRFPQKRWPVENFAALAIRADAAGITPVVIGGSFEAQLGRAITAACPGARDLTGKTSLGELVSLGRQASYAVGNDTGPVHLVAGAGCPTTVLWSGFSDPALFAPRGSHVVILRRAELASLSVDEVAATLPFDKIGQTEADPAARRGAATF